MNESGRVRSIARKIGNSWGMRALGMLILLNIVVLALTCAGSAYFWEKHILGEQWQWDLPRSVRWNAEKNWRNIGEIEYCFKASDGTLHVARIQPVVQAAAPCLAVLFAIEMCMLIVQFSGAHAKARRLLKPLDKMARDMREVSRAQVQNSRYEDRLHDLEDAIGEISPTRPDSQLRTGAEELNGLENAINGLLMRMHESYRQQAQFVSDASHELRTPISVIQGYANMLARWGKDDEKVLSESIAAIQSESNYMKKLVEELLFLARGEIGRNPFEPVELSLTQLIREVCEESGMIDPGHVWEFHGDQEVRVWADAEMLKQCARILSENARKYTPEGGTISLRVSGMDDGWACFRVQDEGIGIAEADAPHIFDRFYRSDPARGRNSGGTGLGLAIAKWIVDRHGGYFELLSREEIGTRITVILPAGQAEEASGNAAK